jgi:hypothetical protein
MPDRKYNVDQELYKGLQVVDDALDWLDNIKLALALGHNFADVLHLIYLIYPPFDPLKTFGKY